MLNKRRLSPWFLLALVVLLAWLSLKIVAVFLDYVAIGLFLAYISHPLYRRMLPKLRSRPLTALTLLVLIGTTVLVPLGFLMAELVK